MSLRGYAHIESTDGPKAVRFGVRNRCLTHSAPSVQSPLLRSCLQQQRSVVHYVLESFHPVASSECIHGNIRHRPFPAIPDTARPQTPPLPLLGCAARFRNREWPLWCVLVRCAPIRETSSSRASVQR